MREQIDKMAEVSWPSDSGRFVELSIGHSPFFRGCGTEFLLVFDDGKFSEFDTFLLTNLYGPYACRGLVEEFQAAAVGFRAYSTPRALHLLGAGPRPLNPDQQQATEATGHRNHSAMNFKHQPDFKSPEGEVRIVDLKKFFIASTMACFAERMQCPHQVQSA